MKKSIFFFACLIVTTLSYAQTSSGDMMLGGGLNFTSTGYQNGDGDGSNEIRFTPGFGYFVNDDLAVGATLGLGSARTGTGDAKTVESFFSFGPFVRYYLFTSNERFAFFGQAQLSFGTRKRNPAVGDVTRGNEIAFALSPGASYFFNDHWALEFALRGLAFSSVDPDTSNDNDKYNTFEFGVNSFSPSLGFRYHF